MLIAWAEKTVRGTKSRAVDSTIAISDRDRGAYKQGKDDLLNHFSPRHIAGAAADMLARLCANHYHTGLLLSYDLTDSFDGLKDEVDQAMHRAKKEAEEETVLDEPLLSETLKQFIKGQPGLKKLAYDRFDNLRKEKKKDEATAAMLQLGKSVSAKLTTSFA